MYLLCLAAWPETLTFIRNASTIELNEKHLQRILFAKQTIQMARGSLARVYIRKTPTSQQNQQKKLYGCWRGGSVGRQYNCRETDFLPYRKQATHFSLRSCCCYSVFIIVTEVANAAQRGVYVMRMSGQ